MNTTHTPRLNLPLFFALLALGSLALTLMAYAVTRRAPALPTAATGRGAQIYASQCATCHGANLEGQPGWQQPLADGSRLAPPHDATGHTWHHPDAQLFQIIREGGQSVSPPGYINRMPAFPNLSDDDIRSVIEFIKSSWPAEIREMHAKGIH